MTKRPLEIVLDDDPDDQPRIYTCTVCGTQGPWGPEWVWYGAWRDIDDGKPVVTCCSRTCRLLHSEMYGLDSGLVTP